MKRTIEIQNSLADDVFDMQAPRLSPRTPRPIKFGHGCVLAMDGLHVSVEDGHQIKLMGGVSMFIVPDKRCGLGKRLVLRSIKPGNGLVETSYSYSDLTQGAARSVGRMRRACIHIMQNEELMVMDLLADALLKNRAWK